MFCGIPYHAALALSGGWWIVSSDTDSPGMHVIAQFLGIWRMPTFFIIAGFFALLVLRRRGANQWFRGRLVRVGLPLLFGLATVVPVQWFIAGFYESGSLTGAMSFAADRLATPSGWWLLHLWFLLALLAYSFVLWVVATVRPVGAVAGRTIRAAGDAVERHPMLAISVYMVFTAAAVIAGNWLWDVVGGDQFAGGLIPPVVVRYAPLFVLGCILASRPRGLAVFLQVPLWLTLGLGFASFGVLLGIPYLELGTLAPAVGELALAVGAIAFASALFRVAERVIRRPSSVVDWIVDSSLVVYLVHQPVIALIAPPIEASTPSTAIAWVTIIALTSIISIALYELINATPGVRFLATGMRSRGRSVFGLTAATPRQ